MSATKPIYRISTGVDGLDRVLGGGLVRGSLTILSGIPGVGKTTLALQALDAVKAWGVPGLLLAEQRLPEIGAAAKRLKLLKPTMVSKLRDSDFVIDIIDIIEMTGGVAVIDSLNAIASTSKGMRVLIRELKSLAAKGHTVIAIMQVVPSGVEDLADVMIEMSSTGEQSHRCLDSHKNRFGPEMGANLKVARNGRLS